MALPTAIFAMVASFALASAAVLSSVDAQQGTKRDRGSKNAIAAADAGASVALLRLNRFQNSLTKATPCVGPDGELETPSGGWCPATQPETVGGATFSYAVSVYQGKNTALSVVSVGTAGGVSRRVEVGLISYNHDEPFSDEQLVGQSDVTLEGNPTLETDLGTNGGIVQKGENGEAAEICGNIRVGPGEEHPEPGCGGEVSEGEKNLPPIVLPENLEAENSDCRLVPDCEEASEVDTYETSNGGGGEKKRTATDPWDAVTKTINVGGNASLTMGGNDYLVCGVFLKGGKLIMAALAHVRIFVDTPEHCELPAGTTQVEVTGSGTISSTGFEAGEDYEVPVIYVLGSRTVATGVKLCGNAHTTNELVLYAPYSDVEICGNATWEGMIAGKTLRLNGDPTIRANPKMPQPDLTVQTLWERTRYVECTGASASPPDASC
jgi:hypothetical protein